MESYWFFDQLLDILICGEQTGGAYSLLETFGPKDCMTPLHLHPRHDEAWSVTEGELTVWIGDDVHVLAPGDSLFAPRGVPHTFKSTGPGAVRMHVVCTPAGFEDYVRAFGTEASAHELPVLEGPPDVARAAALAAEHDIELLGPPGMLPSELPGTRPQA
jgi:quercetin dioxygenase-like cupin family protein